MQMNESCRYMPRPEGTILGWAEKLFSRLTYDVWRRELKHFTGRQETSRLRIVDVGCGPGFLLCCAESWFHEAELIGVDRSEELLAVAKARCRTMTALKGDASSLPLGDGTADAAFAMHVVEHLERPIEFFAEARRVVRPGGLLVIATPNAEGLGARLMGKKWRGHSDPTHISLHGPSFWSDMLDKSGFEIIHCGTTGLSGIPLFNRMPLGLIHWIPVFLCGYLPWKLGEAYVCMAIRRPEEISSAD